MFDKYKSMKTTGGETAPSTSKSRVEVLWEDRDDITGFDSSIDDELDSYLNQGLESIKDEEGNEQLLAWWRERGKAFPTLSIMARNILAIQASSVASESAFSAARFQIGDHRHSLAEDSLEIFVLFRDWINSERRNLGFEKLTTREEEEYNEILSTGSEKIERII